MKRKRQLWMRKIFLRARMIPIFSLMGAISGCSILFNTEEAPTKSANVTFESPPHPFSRVDVGSADRVWQSTRTGNTIAYNSSCGGPDQAVESRAFLSEVRSLKVKKEKNLKVDGIEAQRIHADGNTEGVPISVDVVTYKKGACTFDLAYVARTMTFDTEHRNFDEFVEKFHAP